MSRCGIRTCVIDKREAHVRVGNADGIQARTLEIFDSFDLVDQIWRESCHMAEVSCQILCRLACIEVSNADEHAR